MPNHDIEYMIDSRGGAFAAKSKVWGIPAHASPQTDQPISPRSLCRRIEPPQAICRVIANGCLKHGALQSPAQVEAEALRQPELGGHVSEAQRGAVAQRDDRSVRDPRAVDEG